MGTYVISRKFFLSSRLHTTTVPKIMMVVDLLFMGALSSFGMIFLKLIVNG